MMDMKNTQLKKHLKVLLIIQKEDFLKLKVSGKEKKFHNIKVNLTVKNAKG